MNASPPTTGTYSKPGTDRLDAVSLAEKILTGDRRALARGITLIESDNPEHRDEALALLKAVVPQTGNSIRLGITGVPGVGKSTFIETFGAHIINQGHRIAVLAIDPTSPKTGGSILGDKTRMEELSRNPNAFIRPSPSGGMLGGIARKTYDTLLLCEAAGFDVVIIETVGVGQSETTVNNLVDMFMLLLAPGGGDDLQGIKRGIMEMADILVVNKADGDLIPAAERVRRDTAAALHILRPRDDGDAEPWAPPVLSCSATEGTGITDVWQSVERYRKKLHLDDKLHRRRGQQAQTLMEHEVIETLLSDIRENETLGVEWRRLEDEVVSGVCVPSEAARRLLNYYRTWS